jgi:hypothetical protein
MLASCPGGDAKRLGLPGGSSKGHAARSSGGAPSLPMRCPQRRLQILHPRLRFLHGASR